jgi:hypothetical protein
MMAAAAAAAVAIWVTTVWLLTTADQAKEGTDRAKVRVDAVRTGLAAGAGVGAAIGLMLAFRRQQYQEIATALSDHDAAERRITDLYTKAADQLGSDKAPVRLAGLYALERLANDNPAHRQTIVNVICAYLRMPYTPQPIWPAIPAPKSRPAGIPCGGISCVTRRLAAADSSSPSPSRPGRTRTRNAKCGSPPSASWPHTYESATRQREARRWHRWRHRVPPGSGTPGFPRRSGPR